MPSPRASPPRSSGDRAAAPEVEPRGLPLRSAVVRFTLFVLLLTAALLAVRWTPLGGLLSKEVLVGLLMDLRRAPWSPLLLLGLYAVASPAALPISPLVFAGGAVFGLTWGWLYNFLGSLLGALASYGLARALGRDLVVHLVGESRMRRVDALLSRHGFWTIARLRFVPLPFAVVNFGAALAGARLSTFLPATALGLAPSVFVYTYLSTLLMSAATEERAALIRDAAIVLALILLLTFLPLLGRLLARRGDR